MASWCHGSAGVSGEVIRGGSCGLAPEAFDGPLAPDSYESAVSAANGALCP